MPNVHKHQPLSIRLTPELLARIDRLREPGSTRHGFITWLIVLGVNDMEEEYARHRAAVARAWVDGALQARGALDDD